MANRRTPKRDDQVDTVRTINWFRTLCEHLGEERPRYIQRALDSDSLSESAYGKKIPNSKFKLYAEGKHVPGAAFVEKVEQVVKGSSSALNHVLWKVLRERGSIRKYARDWVRELAPEIQSLVFMPGYELRLYGNRHYVGSLERRASVDGLTVLTILLKLSIEAGDAEQAWYFAHSIFRVLLIIGPELDEQTIAEQVFDLYASRIFPLVSFNDRVMDFENYPFLKMTHTLGVFADRLRQQYGSYRDRKMPSFYALQILNGQYYDLKDLLQPPVKQSTPVPTASA
ncbi:hypothetical protein QF022_002511 [Vogesella perlucida]|nr:hypothetical protein [Vogesella perlucida]